MPKVSVIMPAYNAENYIDEAIESILGQTFEDFEFIIINDCSKDATKQHIQAYADPRICYIENESNMGVAATLNKALDLAQGEYIARMDADDISLPQRLEKQVAFLDENPRVAVLGTNVESFCDSGTLSTGWSATEPRQMKIDLLFSCGIAHPSVMLRTDAIRALGGYDRAYEGLEDYELWFRTAEYWDVTTLPETLLRYRMHSAQVTKNPSEKYLSRLRRLKERQLKSLRLPTSGRYAESFYSYCACVFPQELQSAKDLCVLLESILDANASLRKYDERLLRCNFQSIAEGVAASLKLKDSLALCRKTKLVGITRLAKRKLVRRLGR